MFKLTFPIIFIAFSISAARFSPNEDIKKWAQEEAARQAQLDQSILAAYSKFVVESFELVRLAGIPTADIQTLDLAKIKFLKTLKFFGTADDFQRFNSFYNYRKLFFNLAQQYDLNLPENFKTLQTENAEQQFKFTPELNLPILKLLWASFFSGFSKTKSTPTTHAADHFFKVQGKLSGVDIQLKGQLDISKDPNVINLIVVNHFDAFFDAITIAGFNLPSYLTFGALNLRGEGLFSIASYDFFKPAMKILTNNKDVILLGQNDGNPLEKLIHSINEGRSNTVVLFPQGMIASGFEETLPLKADFSEKVIGAFQKAGYKVDLQIVTSANRYSTTNNISQGKRKLISVIDAKITDSEIRKIIEVGGGQALDLLIRRTWINRVAEFYPNYNGIRVIANACSQFYLK